jgi:nitroimidazol reductase NimA-like FMN-containing flavoprotein (pyridoxamine 5'-phosphate oxidase superfamily)
MEQPDESVLEYVREHRLAVMATQRKAGPPQLTMINYMFDGGEYLVTVRGYSLKAKLLRRRPELSLAIVDGRRQAIVYGTSRLIEDLDEVVTIARRLRAHAGMPEQSIEETREWAEREQRVIIVMTPTSYYPLTMSAPPPATTTAAR